MRRSGRCLETQILMVMSTLTTKNSQDLCSLAELLIQIIFLIFKYHMGDFWKPTADMFSGLIERPKMSDKLLVRPPFKYIFDIVMETIKKTNCGNGLYTGQELNAEYFADRDKKVVYLQRIIKLVQLMNGTNVQAKPLKMVAGLEPELTNIFLQEFYKCATSGKSSEPYVAKVLGKSQQEQPEKKEPEKKEEKKEAEKKQIKKPERPPSAVRLAKKPQQAQQPQQPQQSQPQPSNKKIVKQQEEQPPQEKPVKQQPQKQPAKQEEYSEKVRQVMKEAEQQVAAQKETEKQEAKNTKGINLGKLNKKKKDVADKVISSGGDLTEKQLELVQSMIQSICQNTAPLGKSIEFINDDVEAMNKELTHWRKQYNASKAKTQSQMKLTEQALMPIYDKINEIEEQILDQKSKIQTTKAQILKNDSIIRDLLMSVVTTK